MTVLDTAALAGLTGDAGDVEFVRGFAACYRRMLPERVRRVVAALREPDPDEARDAVLSLKVSSVTVGAIELAELGRRMDDHLRSGAIAAALEVAGALSAAAERCDLALATYVTS